jgi:hypothetical protein
MYERPLALLDEIEIECAPSITCRACRMLGDIWDKRRDWEAEVLHAGRVIAPLKVEGEALRFGLVAEALRAGKAAPFIVHRTR